jgi:hypothetical protein
VNATTTATTATALKFTRYNSITLTACGYTISTIHYSSQSRKFLVSNGTSYWKLPTLASAKTHVQLLVG